MHSGRRKMRCRIQTSPDHSLFTSSPEHFGGYTVFLRLCTPSHPPHTLSSLTTLTLNRSTADPVKDRQNRPLSPGTASGEGPKPQSTTISNGCSTMVGGATCAQVHCRGPPSTRRLCSPQIYVTPTMIYINFSEMWNCFVGVSTLWAPPGRNASAR
jgi:hypothetical protein